MILLLLAVAVTIQGARLSDVVVPAQPPLVLELPASDPVVTGDLLERLLTQAGVLFGLEVVWAPGPQAQPNFARRPDRTLVLNGMSVRKALDAIVAADPRYVWEELDGRIIVRGAGTSGVLGMKIAPLTLTDAPLTDALKALMSRLDASVVPAVLVGGVVMASSSGATEAPLRKAPLVASIAPQSNVFDALNAIAQPHQVSWKLRYEHERMDAASTSIAFLGAGRFVAATSPDMARRRAGGRANERVLVPIMGQIGSMIALYRSRMRAQFGLELLPEQSDRRPSTGHPPLDLTNLPVADGLTKILELDSRYEWFESSGMFIVRPRRTVIESTLLDREIAGFAANGELLDDIMARIIVALGAKPEGRGSGVGGADDGASQRKQKEALARPLTFRVERGTLRDVLNALCRAEGTLSWVMHPQPEPTGQGVFVMFQVNSVDGWNIGRNFRVSRW